MMNSRLSSPSSISPRKINEVSSSLTNIWMIFSILLWCLFLVFIHLVPPDRSFNIFVFFILLFSSLLSTFLVLVPRRKLCFILSFYLISLSLLLMFHQFSLLNFILVTLLWSFLLIVKKDYKTTINGKKR